MITGFWLCYYAFCSWKTVHKPDVSTEQNIKQTIGNINDTKCTSISRHKKSTFFQLTSTVWKESQVTMDTFFPETSFRRLHNMMEEESDDSESCEYEQLLTLLRKDESSHPTHNQVFSSIEKAAISKNANAKKPTFKSTGLCGIRSSQTPLLFYVVSYAALLTAIVTILTSTCLIL